MLRNTVFLLCAAALGSLSPGSALAGDYGDILAYQETFVGQDRDAKVEVTLKGKTNKDGELYVPVPAQGVDLVKTTGTLVADKPDKPRGGEKALVYKFDKGGQEVAMTFGGTAKDFFKGKPAGGGESSYPGQIESVGYTFTNGTPAAISNYEFRVVMPAGLQLGEIPKDAKMVEEGAAHQFFLKKAKVLATDKVAVKFSTYHKPAVFNAVMWGIILLVSAFWLWVRRDVLLRLAHLDGRGRVAGSGHA